MIRVLIPAIIVIVVLIIIGAILLAGRRDSLARENKRLRGSLHDYQELVTKLRDQAYDHLELAEPFAAIVRDEIRNFYKKNPKELDK